MELLRWGHRPALRHPVLVAAFEGWNDAGNAASEAVTFLSQAWGASAFAEFDGDELFDYTSSRPQVRLEAGKARRLEWPAVTLASAALPGAERDVIFLSGPEPQLRWKGFSRELGQACLELGVDLAVLLGALLADVPHTRPVRISGGAATSELSSLAGLEPSYYEGPTGILGVVGDTLGRSSVPTVSLWASVPHYVSQSTSPKATLALVERTSRLLATSVDVVELQIASAAYERQINELVASDDDASAYVTRLEEQEEEDDDPQLADADLPTVDDGPRLSPASGERLAAEVERYLREHRHD
jgi:hypothetical protein